jgi:uncharacterized delta-60 repeat protein
VAPDGKIVAIGLKGTLYPHFDMLVVRFLTDGTLDSSFNGSGIVVTDFDDGVDSPQSVAVRPDGRIVVVGVSSNGGEGSAGGVVRYNVGPSTRLSTARAARPCPCGRSFRLPAKWPGV